LLLLLGLIIRILFINEQGLSNDELSAWYRTRFTDWNSFWELGVKTGDMHPAFYQVLLWIWVRVFGDSEWALRSTSLIFYILNSYLIYQICSRYFIKLSGLFIQAIYVGLTFTIMNTVFTRPYNSGTFFLLLSFWAVLEIRNNTVQSKWKWTIILAVSLLGAMLSHYFAFLVASVLGAISMVYVGKKNIKFILISGGIAIIGFLPHISITLFQTGRGGLGWLAAPDKYWITDFIHQFFNESWILFAILVGLLLIAILLFGFKKITGEMIFSFAIFVVTFCGAFVLSHIFTPILRDLVMLFLLPFLMIPLFSVINFKEGWKSNLLIASVAIVPLIHSIWFHKVFEPNHFGDFKNIGKEINLAINQYSKDSITFASNYNNVEYINYYVENDLEETIIDWDQPNAFDLLNKKVQKAKTPYFCYSVNNKYHSPMFLELIRQYYPKVQKTYLTKYSSFYLFSKKGDRNLKDVFYTGKYIDPGFVDYEFFNEKKIALKSLPELKSAKDYYLIKSSGEIIGNQPVFLVAVIERDSQILMKNELPYAYFAFDQSKLKNAGSEQEFLLAFDLPEGLMDSDILKIYFWNPQKGKIKTSNLKLYVVHENN